LAFFKELSKFDVFVILSKVLLIKLAPHSNGCENYACIIEKKERERERKEREREREHLAVAATTAVQLLTAAASQISFSQVKLFARKPD
jgi:hypothetical protein